MRPGGTGFTHPSRTPRDAPRNRHPARGQQPALVGCRGGHCPAGAGAGAGGRLDRAAPDREHLAASAGDDPAALFRQHRLPDHRHRPAGRGDGHRIGLAGRDARLSRPPRAGMAAAAAPGSAGLCRRLCAGGFPRLLRPGADCAARILRLVERPRLLVSGDPVARGGGAGPVRRALSLCLPAGARELSRAAGRRLRGRPRAGNLALGCVPARRPAARPPGDRRGQRDCHDGDGRRLRRRQLFRRADAEHRHLHHLARGAERRRRGADRHGHAGNGAAVRHP